MRASRAMRDETYRVCIRGPRQHGRDGWNEVLPALRASDLLKIGALNIGGRNREAAQCADRIQGSPNLFEVNLIAGHLFADVWTKNFPFPRRAANARA
jgi:hypothetical protein